MDDSEYWWLTGRVLRAARLLSGKTASEIAQLAGVGEATIKRAEATDGVPGTTRANLMIVVACYRALGIHIDGGTEAWKVVIRVDGARS